MTKIINIGIVAHIDAGKTTLTEHILFESGITRTKGRVDHASTVTDDLAVERRRGITVKEKTVTFQWGDTKINLLDTPGHADFLCEVVRAFHVLDAAVLVISAKESVQPQTVAIYNLLAGIGLPVVIFINKLDRIGADAERVSEDIAALGIKHIMMRWADENINIKHWRENVGYTEDNLLTLSEFDDGIIERFDEGQDVDDTVYRLAAEGKVIPVYMGVALHGIGIKDLLDALVSIQPRIPMLPQNAPVSAIIYKIQFNERGERKIYFRMYGGTLNVRDKIGVAQKPDVPPIQIKSLETPEGAKLVITSQVSVGEIGVITNVDGLFVGDILGEKWAGMRTVTEVKPIFTADIAPAKSADKARFLEAMMQMNLEDKNLNIMMNETGASIHLFGEIQKEIVKTLLAEKYGIETVFSETKTIYMETPSGSGKSEEDGLVGFTVEPLPTGSGVKYETRRTIGHTGGLTQQRLDAVERAALDSLVPGIIMERGARGDVAPFRPGRWGWEVTDIRIIFDVCNLPPGQQQPSAGVFYHETPYALRQAIRNAGSQLLEPVYVYEIVAEGELCGKITNEITMHNGTISAIEESGVHVKINGKIPARFSHGFLIQFQSLTKNMASFDVLRVEFCGIEKQSKDV
jgi:ribosomal protection tetracycline resistance protein